MRDFIIPDEQDMGTPATRCAAAIRAPWTFMTICSIM
ncbi:hypothetical protein ACSSV8_002810 [Roseovarius sp. MBR-79]|jgi:hypothetical protein